MLDRSGVLSVTRGFFDFFFGFCFTNSLLQIWHANVPYDKLASYKQDQNWVKKQGDHMLFPGGGTQFKNGAGQYINAIQKVIEFDNQSHHEISSS
jgi:hypothetical protein